MKIINKTKEKKDALDIMLASSEMIAINLRKTIKINKKSKFNYEELKNSLKYEDLFYDVCIKNIAEKSNCNVRFDGQNVIFELKEDK